MDKVFINDLMIRGVIGISDRERSQPQDIVVNVVLYTDITKGAASDNIEDCTNYRTITKAIIAHVEKVSRYTVEALAEDIAGICLKTVGVKKVKVRVEKPGAVRFSKSVGVEITRKNTG
ncbi:MAG TPA: dihydroneopterin aldolase [Anaerolineaceae bacterium]|uniref:7,8-dihydroneopterin aldolase n=1 Tax=Anaerolinea thermophila TaxID=167964 RepID=A0A101FZ89_9CHLR|nr:MAG: Dihydroneopterin aldolase [Anaerolinea thermophila]HAF62196.1 dihydroneopterin aldolase [Anaerolineaceae bacterium]